MCVQTHYTFSVCVLVANTHTQQCNAHTSVFTTRRIWRIVGLRDGKLSVRERQRQRQRWRQRYYVLAYCTSPFNRALIGPLIEPLIES